MALNNKQQLFVSEYFLCGMNATKAALNAGYSPKTAYSIGQENLKKPEIAAEIDRLLKVKQLSADEVLARLGDMARSDIADFAKIRKVSDLQDDDYRGKTHVIKKFKTKIIIDALGRQVEQVELELYDAQAALEKVGRHYALFTDNINQSGELTFRVIHDDAGETNTLTEVSSETD